jgi:nitrate reductase NapAB chaperone NapD
MPIAGVVILTSKTMTDDILESLQEFNDITTYGIHKDIYIVAVLESENAEGLEKLSKDIEKKIPGILGVYPAYVNFEDQVIRNPGSNNVN